MKQTTYEKLGDMEKTLLDAAEKAMETAYAPYSKFYVGAAILTENGEIITGSNVENASYGLVVCAERTAIFRANAMGIRAFKQIATIARGENFDCTEITGPCGACRQVIYEFAQLSKYGKDFPLIDSSTKKDKIAISTIGELLPLSFGPADLGIDLNKYRK